MMMACDVIGMKNNWFEKGLQVPPMFDEKKRLEPKRLEPKRLEPKKARTKVYNFDCEANSLKFTHLFLQILS